ncbi:MAG: YbaB/EbfC family nucleoid-associated protein [Tissierellia bacterium]|nr:YbaB/EbfC family nucleoid-associated protein [Tissierellia bacterium]
MARGGFPGMGNMGNMMKQMKKVQKQMEEMQKQLEQTEVEASAGGGAVTVKANGKKEIISITIDEMVVDPEDVEMLQDLILAAVNEALRSAEELAAQEMNKLTGGMNIPGLF